MSLISREKLLAHFSWWPDTDENKGIFESIIARQPDVDAVPVVRCGECKHRDKVTGWCADVQDYISNTNWFCAGGEKGEDDE